MMSNSTITHSEVDQTADINPPATRSKSEDIAFVIKWVASIIQILGYATTAFGITPLNIYLFLAGLIGWFIVGVMWNDRAIMLIHLVALGAMLVGLAS